MNVTAEELRRYWRTLTDETPNAEILTTFARYASISRDCSDHFLALLVESCMKFFPSETQRSIWIAKSIAEQNATPVALRAA